MTIIIDHTVSSAIQATTKTKTEQRVVAELRRGQIGPGTSDFWEGVTMRIPAVPPTNLAGDRTDQSCCRTSCIDQ